MPYTNAWNETTPLGSASANTIDDLMRQSKLDLRERINSLIGVAIGTALADPVVAAGTDLTSLKSVNDTQTTNITTLQGLTGSQTLSLWMPWNYGFAESPVVSVGGQGVSNYDTNSGLYIRPILDGNQPLCTVLSVPIVLPVGVTITGVIGYFERPTQPGPTATLTLHSLSNTGGRSSIASQVGTTGTTGTFNVSLGTLSTTTLVDTGYFVRITFGMVSATNEPRYFGLKLLYTSPDTTKRV